MKPREWFGYWEGETYQDGERVYCLTEGKPDKEFSSEAHNDPIHVIEYSAYETAIRERDDAMNLLGLSEYGCASIADVKAKFAELLRERDEARAEVKEIREYWNVKSADSDARSAKLVEALKSIYCCKRGLPEPNLEACTNLKTVRAALAEYSRRES